MKTLIRCIICAVLGAVAGFHLPVLYFQIFDPQFLDTVGGLSGLGLLSLLIVSAQAGFILGILVGIIPTVRAAKRTPPSQFEKTDGVRQVDEPHRHSWM